MHAGHGSAVPPRKQPEQRQEEKRESTGFKEDKQSIHGTERGISEVHDEDAGRPLRQALQSGSGADFRRVAASVTVSARLALPEFWRRQAYAGFD